MSCPFSVRPTHPPFVSTSTSPSSGCPFSSSSTEPSAIYLPHPSPSNPSLADAVSLAPPSSPKHLADTLPAGPQPSPLSSSHPLSPSTAALHRALHGFRAVTPKYASTPYDAAFNWAELDLGLETSGVWYCVAFRSHRRPGTEDDQALYDADKAAHEEALDNGGLLLYWYGRPDADGANLATCVWESRTHARLANARPHHLRAVRLAARAYSEYTLERYTLRKLAGEARVRVEPFKPADELGPGAGVEVAHTSSRAQPVSER